MNGSGISEEKHNIVHACHSISMILTKSGDSGGDGCDVSAISHLFREKKGDDESVDVHVLLFHLLLALQSGIARLRSP